MGDGNEMLMLCCQGISHACGYFGGVIFCCFSGVKRFLHFSRYRGLTTGKVFAYSLEIFALEKSLVENLWILVENNLWKSRLGAGREVRKMGKNK